MLFLKPLKYTHFLVAFVLMFEFLNRTNSWMFWSEAPHSCKTLDMNKVSNLNALICSYNLNLQMQKKFYHPLANKNTLKLCFANTYAWRYKRNLNEIEHSKSFWDWIILNERKLVFCSPNSCSQHWNAQMNALKCVLFLYSLSNWHLFYAMQCSMFGDFRNNSTPIILIGWRQFESKLLYNSVHTCNSVSFDDNSCVYWVYEWGRTVSAKVIVCYHRVSLSNFSLFCR